MDHGAGDGKRHTQYENSTTDGWAKLKKVL